MTIKKKASKGPSLIQSDIEDMIGQVIGRGGKTTTEGEPIVPQKVEPIEEEIRFTLRIPSGLIKQIDDARRPRVGNISRNQWILEAISKTLD